MIPVPLGVTVWLATGYRPHGHEEGLRLCERALDSGSSGLRVASMAVGVRPPISGGWALVERAMPRRLLPFVPAPLSVVRAEPAADHLVICVAPRPGPAYCPGCRTCSRRPHGHYERTLADLPWQGRPVLLRLQTRRFRCPNASCPRRTFSEAIGAVLAPRPVAEVVARDRAEVFAEGARAGTPQARQVLDRFHLLCNLSVALRAIVAHHHAVFRVAGRAVLSPHIAAARIVARAARPSTAIETRERATHAPRRARHAELKRLAEAGASVAGMARALDLDRKTVRGLAAPGCTARLAPPPRSAHDPRSPSRRSRGALAGGLPQRRRAGSRADPRRRRHPSARGARLGDEAPSGEHGRAGYLARIGEPAVVAATVRPSDDLAPTGGPERVGRGRLPLPRPAARGGAASDGERRPRGAVR